MLLITTTSSTSFSESVPASVQLSKTVEFTLVSERVTSSFRFMVVLTSKWSALLITLLPTARHLAKLYRSALAKVAVGLLGSLLLMIFLQYKHV